MGTTQSTIGVNGAPWARGRHKGFRSESDLYALAFALCSRREGETWAELLATHELGGREFVQLFKLMCAEKKGLVAALDLFEYLKNSTDADVRNVFCFTALINGSAAHMDEEGVMQLLEEMHALGIQPSAATYTAVMKCVRDRPRRMETVMQMMRDGGLTLTMRTYTTYIASLGRRGQCAKALAAFADMKAEGVKPNQFTYGAIISAVARTGDVDKASDLLEEMLDAGLTPNEFVYSSLISCCKRGGRWEQALDFFEEMVEEDNIKPDVVTFTALIDVCGSAGQWQKAHELYQQMKAHGVQPNRATLRAVYLALRSAADEDGCDELIARVEKEIIKRGLLPYSLLKEARGFSKSKQSSSPSSA